MPDIESKKKTQECPESIYEAVLPVILSRLENPSTVKSLVETLGVNKTQLNAWLKKAVEENKLDKLSKLKPVCYQKPRSLFDIPCAPEAASIKEQQTAKKSIKKVPDVESKKKTQASSEFIYEAVLPVILSRLKNPSTAEELAEILGMGKMQLHVWFKKAVNENKIIKLSNPVRYQKAQV